jgi:acyl carrier protein
MTELEIKDKLRTIIAEITEIEEFEDDEDFINDLGIDSMMTIEIIARVEKKFMITVSESYLLRFSNLIEATRVVNELQN